MRPLTWLARLGLVVAAGALLLTSVVVAVAPRIWQVANAHEERPVELPPFTALAQRSYAYDIFGNEIAAFQLENSQPVPLADIPDDVIASFLAVEDKEFYGHDGVNVRSLFRATLSNFASDAPQQGASTITMQVAKNDFLAGLERDGTYKLLQAHYALMLERELTKDEILERYLNTVFFGNNAYGIQAAAETYFAKTVDQLEFIEAAFLAGLVRSPTGYDPINEPERSRARFAQVLDRLVEDEYVTQLEADQFAETFVLPERVRTTPERQYTRTYYTEALRDYLLNKSDILGETYQERYTALYRGGVRVHTTFDPFVQSYAESARNILPDTPQGFDAAIVTLDSATGAIRAMVGGRGFVANENETNMALAPRQTGSSIKLFILAAALQAGAQPDDLIDGPKTCILPNPDNPREPFEISAEGVGLATLDEMTARSINCAYARLSQIVGLNRVVDTTYRMARSPYLYLGQPEDEHPTIQPYASFATGANEMSPLDMAAGAQTIANEGIHHEPFYVEFVEKADGTRIYTHEDAGQQILDRGVALTAASVLKGPLERGTAREWPLETWTAAGKTGTQDDNTNAWFVGFTTRLTTAVWVGDPDAYTRMENIPEFDGRNREKVQGGRYPAQIWNAVMNPAHANLPPVDWEGPPIPPRPAMRLYLPGVECLVRRAGSGNDDGLGSATGGATTTTAAADDEPDGFAGPLGFAGGALGQAPP
ncbi:MAG: penicillin-binding protein, partial [Acidimicrobiia bacterium]|nr:penicillin-binding protein [Acidimicrobiia bacterium]